MTQLSDQVREVYEENAVRFDKARSKVLQEARWLTRFGDALPKGGSVLDLGCGTGRPIASWLIGEGFNYTGVDFAGAMLDIARHHWPQQDWRQGDMRDLDLPERFDGIIAWNSFFHLTPDEQRACLPRLGRHLRANGVLIFTVGAGEGETTGKVGGSYVYHASLSPLEYVKVLSASGLRLTAFLAEDPDCETHSVFMVRKDRKESS